MVAIIASLLVISVYVALRFEWKFAVPVLIALMHDLLITSGVYALTGREVTTATVAALLTILGYSLYDTIIVFDRVRENMPRMPRAAFSQIVNRSMSEVLTRSLATTSCTLMPIIALLLFGGATLKDFAFALLIGVASGAYSSIFIASPVLTHWKEREPGYRARRHRIEEELGVVPAYAGTGADVEPTAKRARRTGRLTTPEAETVSAAEFEQMKRDLEIERGAPSRPHLDADQAHVAHGRDRGAGRDQAGAAEGGRRAAGPHRYPRRAAHRTERPRRAAHRTERPTRAGARHRRERGRGAGPEAEGRVEVALAQPPARETSLMGMLAWVMMGLALWHFTIWLPDRFWGGIVGAFVGALVGAVLFGFIVNGFHIPGRHDTHIATALEAIPGRADRHGAGLPRGRPARARLRADRHRADLIGQGPGASFADGRLPVRGQRVTVRAEAAPNPCRNGHDCPPDPGIRRGRGIPWRCARGSSDSAGPLPSLRSRPPVRVGEPALPATGPGRASDPGLRPGCRGGARARARAQPRARAGARPARTRRPRCRDRVPGPERGARSGRVRRDRAAVAMIERHVVPRAGSSSTATTTSTASARPRSWSARCARSAPTSAGSSPDRIEDGYGLSLATVERLAARGTDLLITVDCGITAVEEVAAARRAGLDVVVTDHHAPRADGELPDCPIVHPAVCGYPCPDLCGTAVAHKLAEALGAATAADDLELVALATVADLVPLRGENRRLVREGLARAGEHRTPGLRALMAVSRVDPSALDARALGFRLAPRINAAGRLRRADAGLELLLTDDPERAREIAAELDAVNAERRAVEQRIVWEAEAQVAELGRGAPTCSRPRAGIPGVIGIVASRIVERHHRPAILIALDDARRRARLGAQHPRLRPARRAARRRRAPGALRRPPRRGRADDRRATASTRLREAIERHAERRADAGAAASRSSASTRSSRAPSSGSPLAEELEALEPCGMGNPGPRLLVPGARFDDVRPMGEGRHARFSVSSGGARARAVAFGCDGRLAVRRGRAGRRDLPARAQRVATARSSRGWCCATRSPARRRRSRWSASRRTTWRRRSPSSTRSRTPARVRRRPRAPRRSVRVRVGRVVLDRRGESPLAVLADAIAAGGDVLAVCADVPRRLGGLAARAGGFALIGHHALARDPGLARPASRTWSCSTRRPASRRTPALRAGSGFTHLAWGEAELRFAEQMHELEYGLRTSLVALYRGLRDRQQGGRRGARAPASR